MFFSLSSTSLCDKQSNRNNRSTASPKSTGATNLFASTYGPAEGGPTTRTTDSKNSVGADDPTVLVRGSKRKEDQQPSTTIPHPSKHPRQRREHTTSETRRNRHQKPPFSGLLGSTVVADKEASAISPASDKISARQTGAMPLPLEYQEQIASYKAQIAQEKAG